MVIVTPDGTDEESSTTEDSVAICKVRESNWIKNQSFLSIGYPFGEIFEKFLRSLNILIILSNLREPTCSFARISTR